ncbi:hypothetical protein K438DRAFT_887720 [Mycena galopus ATCC 62051]|nr:hypothetical protein K438DRAFT_887720 [Mycena galopus ATCC 62051]
MTKRSSVGGSGKSTPTPSFVKSPSPAPSLVQSPSPKGMSYQTSPSPSQQRYQPPPSPPSPSSSRERMPRNTSFSSTTVSTSTSTSMSSSAISSSGPDTPRTVHSSPEPIKGWPTPLDTSISTASMDTNVSGRSSTYMASTPSVNGLDGENDEEINGRHKRRSETTTVEIWPSSPTSATIARKPVNGSRLALTMEAPTDSEESEEEAMERDEGRGSTSGSDREEEEYGPEDGGWANRHHGGTLPLQVVKLSPNPNAVPPSPYEQAYNDHESTRSDSRPDSVNHNDSSRSTDSESNYNTTESEDNAEADETTFAAPIEQRSPSPSIRGSTHHHATPSISDSVKSRTRSIASSTHDGSTYSNTTNSEEPTRSSIVAPSLHGSEDGEVGIGLSLLQYDEDSDSDEAPSAGATPQKDASQRQSVLSDMRGPPQPGDDDWDGGSIYENYYRFSRFSTNPRASTSTTASGKIPARFSQSSHRGMPTPSTSVVPPVPVDPRSEPETNPSQAESNGSGQKRRSADSDASVYTQASKVSSIDPSRLSVQQPLHNHHRPSPLELTGINGEPSPLLHTRWGSPASSPSPPTSSNAGQTSFSDGTPPGSASSGNLSPGGAASLLRQRIEIDRSSPIGSYTKLDPPEGEGLGGGIVIEDDEDAPTRSVTTSITSDPRSESPETEVEADGGDDTVTKRPGLETLAPLVIDNPPSPPVNSFANTSPSSATTTTPLSPPSPPDLPPPPPAQTTQQSQHQTRPSLSELRGYAQNDPPSQRRPSTDKPGGERTSMFLPHPNAPKAPPVTGAPEGPLYIRQPPPPSQQRSESLANVINMSIGRSKVTRVMPTIYGRTELDLMSSTGPVRMMFSIDPLPPLSAPLPSQIPFRNGASPLVHVPPPGPSAAVPRRMTAESEPGNTSQPGPAGSPKSPMPRGRSPSATAASPVSAVPGKSSPLAEKKPASADLKPSAPIPRSNFLPKSGTSRPRSRSFSGFNTAEISLPLGRR